MSTDPGGSGEFIRPFLHAMAKVTQRETLRPGQLRDRSAQLLRDTFGPSEEAVVSSFSIGQVGLVSEHTYYFDGFALLLPLPFGVSVAIRPCDETSCRVVFEGSPTVHTPADGSDTSVAVPPGENGQWAHRSKAVELVRRMLGDEPYHIAVVSTVPEACEDGFMAAVACALEDLRCEAGVKWDLEVLRRLAGVVEETIERPYGIAPIIGARHASAGASLLVDTMTGEHIGLDLPVIESMAWGFVDTHHCPEHRSSIFRKRREDAVTILEKLHEVGFSDLVSIRDLEHRHLQLAIKRLPRRLHAPLRYLVTENRRVQRLVAALRRGDTQLFGAFLHMSNASIVNDWKERNPEIERIRSLAEEVEGMEGVRRVGREFGSAALVTGRPLAMTQFLDRIADPDLEETKGMETILL